MAVIYLLTNKVNGKQYVGFSSNYEKRMNWYKSGAKGSKRKSKIISALKKYGWDSFESEIIYTNDDVEYTLNVMENKYINEYNTYKEGYNLTEGGEGCLGWKPSEEDLLRMSKNMKGDKNPFHKSKGRDNPMKGKKHKKESIELMKKNRKGLTAGEKNPMYGKGDKLKGGKNGRATPIVIFGKEYETLKICENETGISLYLLRKYLKGLITEEYIINKVVVN